jgi:hypothetical protein
MSDIVLSSQDFQPSDRFRHSKNTLEKTPGHRIWGTVLNHPQQELKSQPKVKTRKTTKLMLSDVLPTTSLRQSSHQLSSRRVSEFSQTKDSSVKITFPVETQNDAKVKLTRQEVYDAIIMDKPVHDTQVFQSMITYSPLGIPRVVPATRKLIQEWHAAMDALNYCKKPDRHLTYATDKSEQLEDNPKKSQFKVGELTDHTEIPESSDSVSASSPEVLSRPSPTLTVIE